MTSKPLNPHDPDSNKPWKAQAPPPLVALVKRYIKGNNPLIALVSAKQAEHKEAVQPANGIILRQRLNDLPKVNAFLMELHAYIREGGYLFGCVETIQLRKKKLMASYPSPLNRLIYLAETLFKRAGARVAFLRPLYFRPGSGRSWPMWEIEVLGRLCACGYYPEETTESDGLLYFCARKLATPSNFPKDRCGPIISLRRVGKRGKHFYMHKFRTMYPYSEYLQEYIFNNNGLQKGGKFKDDPRITHSGRFMRRYWIDEIPNLINLLKLEIKLFGLRPISDHYLSLYPESFQEQRKRFKPGMIPPEYVDRPKTIEEIVETEMRYIKAYERSPFLTDLKYTVRALYNIIVKKVRSK
ncbi:MAG: sugar transferase [Lewinellaceae bacterium]|nr:sugar transferase [Lewinellaceae bacterium]